MHDKDILKFIRKYKIMIGGITIIIVIILISLFGDSSNNKKIELETDISKNKTMRDKVDINKIEGNYIGRDNVTNIINNKSEDKTVSQVYKDINITGKIVNKGIKSVIVELVSPSFFSEPSDESGSFTIYIKKPTFREMGQIRVAETDLYYKYEKDIDLNAKNFPLELKMK